MSPTLRRAISKHMTRRAGTVVLHVGHGKTGSSYIQSSLALSLEALAQNGVIYPDHLSLKRAAQGKISSGNARYEGLADAAEAELRKHPSASRILYSYEGLIRNIVNDPSEIESLRSREMAVTLILFVRDPFEHAVSSYVQAVKRGGSTKALSETVTNMDTVQLVRRFIELGRNLECDLKIANYSRHSNRLLSEFANLLSVPEDCLQKPPHAIVNRSLTRSELMLQRKFNEHYGRKCGQMISDPLCEQLPEIASERPYFTDRDVRAFYDKHGSAIAQTNQLLPEDARYAGLQDAIGKTQPESAPSLYEFTEEQLDVIARSVCQHLGASSKASRQARIIRDIAFKIENGRAISPAETQSLLSIALDLKPNDKLLLARQNNQPGVAPMSETLATPLLTRLKNKFRRYF